MPVIIINIKCMPSGIRRAFRQLPGFIRLRRTSMLHTEAHGVAGDLEDIARRCDERYEGLDELRRAFSSTAPTVFVSVSLAVDATVDATVDADAAVSLPSERGRAIVMPAFVQKHAWTKLTEFDHALQQMISNGALHHHTVVVTSDHVTHCSGPYATKSFVAITGGRVGTSTQSVSIRIAGRVAFPDLVVVNIPLMVGCPQGLIALARVAIEGCVRQSPCLFVKLVLNAYSIIIWFSPDSVLDAAAATPATPPVPVVGMAWEALRTTKGYFCQVFDALVNDGADDLCDDTAWRRTDYAEALRQCCDNYLRSENCVMDAQQVSRALLADAYDEFGVDVRGGPCRAIPLEFVDDGLVPYANMLFNLTPPTLTLLVDATDGRSVCAPIQCAGLAHLASGVVYTLTHRALRVSRDGTRVRVGEWTVVGEDPPSISWRGVVVRLRVEGPRRAPPGALATATNPIPRVARRVERRW
jgi:hypothetical protein